MASTKVNLIALAFALTFFNLKAFATTYSLPNNNESIVGNKQISYLNAKQSDVTKIATHFDVGFNALQKANPLINFAKPISSQKKIIIPTEFLLPNLPHKGIIVNLPEMRMYYFPENDPIVITYPIGIGKIGKTIPTALATITRKTKDPVWVPTEDIRQFNLAQGIVLPQIMPPGPDNPLGPYAIYMSVPTYLMHSTIYPESIGKRASFGCIRMYQSDIEQFFPMISKGLPVAIINSPIKIGWQNKRLFMEAHAPLAESDKTFEDSLAGAVSKINQESAKTAVLIDWQAVAFIEQERDGLPHEVGTRI